MNWQHLYLSFTGRTSKRDYWIGLAGLLAGGIAASLLPVIGPVLSIALLWPFTALASKRLHDFGRSAWLVALPVAPAAMAMIVALLAATAIGNPITMGAGLAAAGLAALLSGIAMVIGLGFLIWTGIRDGDSGANMFGEPSGTALLS